MDQQIEQGSIETEQQTRQRESIDAAQQESIDPITEQNNFVTSQPIAEKIEKNETAVPPDGIELKVCLN